MINNKPENILNIFRLIILNELITTFLQLILYSSILHTDFVLIHLQDLF